MEGQLRSYNMHTGIVDPYLDPNESRYEARPDCYRPFDNTEARYRWWTSFFPPAKTCAARPQMVVPDGGEPSMCHEGCDYDLDPASGGLANATPTGATCNQPVSVVDPGKNNCCSDQLGPVTKGNPVNMLTGAKLETQIDYRAPTGHLELMRYYSSTDGLQPLPDLDGTWRHTYQRALQIIDSSTVILLRPTGDFYTYKKSASTWSPDWDVRERLTELTNGSGITIGWVVTSPDDSQEHFDAAGVLIGISYTDGEEIVLAYSSGKLQSVTDRHGRMLVFAYTGNKLTAVSLPDGRAISYGYDVQSRLSSVGYQNNTGGAPLYDTVQYRYEDPSYADALTSRLDEQNGVYATWEYDSEKRVIRSVHGNPAGAIDQFTFAYASNGSTVTSPLGDSVYYSSLKQLGRLKLAAAQEPCGSCGVSFQTRTYDSNGYPDITVDFEGVSTDQDYTPRGQIYRKIDAANDVSGKKRTIDTYWHGVFNAPAARYTYDAAGALVARSSWSYNVRGQVILQQQYNPSAGTARNASLTYCEQTDVTAGTCPLLGLVTAIDGSRTDVTDTTTYTYYATDDASCSSSPSTCPHRKGDLWKVTDALGRITETLAYDGAGRPLSIKDANGVITDMVYHPRGWLTARKVRGTNNAVETDDQITQIEYWPTGLVKKVTQPDGAFTSYAYDAAHRLTNIADNAGNTIHYTLDNAGNRTAEDTKDSGSTLRRTLSRVYNQLGQLQTAKDAYNHATGFTYDANGNNQLVTDALSRVTDNDYDPLNRLARTLQDVGGIAAETKFEYDALDRLTKVTDPKGLDTIYQYNGFGDLIQLTSPDTGITTYTYDNGGNRRTQSDARGITTNYVYDALNRLSGIYYPTSSLNVGYFYDTVNPACTVGETFAIGRLSKMTDSSGDTQYCYDRFGNLTRKVQTTNAKVFTLRYAYTLAGHLQAITYPDGAMVDYVRDGQGRITEVGATPAGGVRAVLLNQATYHPFGPVAGWVYGNGRTMSRPVNQNYQPAAVADNASGGLSLGYEFDAVGNLSKLYNADQSVTKAQYVYDALNRLADVKDGPTGTVIEHYGYDATGNRTSFTNAGGTINYTYPSTNHRLTQLGATIRSYDNVGNTIQIGGTAKEFVYSDAGRMSQVNAGGMTTMNYQLNGRGELVRKYLNTNNSYTVYDEAGRWAGDYDNNGNALQQAIWLDDLPVALLASNQLKYLQPDQLGTPRAVIDPASNGVIWRWELEGEAFGNTVPNQDADSNGIPFVFNMRFPGQRYDAASGLNYNYFRDYEPGAGRYPQSDPIGLAGGLSTYGYANQNPLLFIDPSGLKTTVTVRCGSLPASMGGSSGGVHCEVVAICDKTGESTAFGIGGGGNGIWERLFGGKIPPKYQNPAPPRPGAGIDQYSASCGSEGECGCATMDCFKNMQAANTPPPYYAVWQNSNSYAHTLLSQCGCTLNTSPSGAVGWGNTNPINGGGGR